MAASFRFGHARATINRQQFVSEIPLKAPPNCLFCIAPYHSCMCRESPKFRELPDDCTCLGEGPAPVGRVPRFGAMPELVTYQCPACGHVETIEIQPATPLTTGER